MKTKFNCVFLLIVGLCGAQVVTAEDNHYTAGPTYVTVTNNTSITIPLTAWGQNASNSWPACSPSDLGDLAAHQTKTYEIDQCTASPQGWITISMVGRSHGSLPSPGCFDECWASINSGQSNNLVVQMYQDKYAIR